jgi:hypothetical protein
MPTNLCGPAVPKLYRTPMWNLNSRFVCPLESICKCAPVRIGMHHSTAAMSSAVTVRVCRTFVADYRDWSWHTRCHLSHLVEEAFADYPRRHRPS